jgi:hypothetical protein
MNAYEVSNSQGWAIPSLSLLVLAFLCLGLTACGDSGASQSELEAARKQGASKARQQQKIQAIEKELKNLKKGKTGGAAAADGTVTPVGDSSSGTASGNCGGSLSVNENTSCGFAENVEGAYYEKVGSGSGVIYAYSPTTGKTYSMYCTAGSPHECTGGNNAAVYFP